MDTADSAGTACRVWPPRGMDLPLARDRSGAEPATTIARFPERAGFNTDLGYARTQRLIPNRPLLLAVYLQGV